MSTLVPDEGIARLRRTGMKGGLAKLRSRIFARRLDAELAAGADPWGSCERLLRAEYLVSPAARRGVAADLQDLVRNAQARRVRVLVMPTTRHRLVWGLREEFLALAARLRQPEPVQVIAVAQLTVLMRDRYSPIYVGGRPPRELIRTFERVLQSM